MAERELVVRRVTALEQLERHKQLGMVLQRARDRAHAPHVLGVHLQEADERADPLRILDARRGLDGLQVEAERLESIEDREPHGQNPALPKVGEVADDVTDERGAHDDRCALVLLGGPLRFAVAHAEGDAIAVDADGSGLPELIGVQRVLGQRVLGRVRG